MTTPTPTRARTAWHFVRQYAEMLVAMLVGMVALNPLWMLLWPGLHSRPDAAALVMATDMTIGMAAWMAVRRHSWVGIGQMSAAMYLPFLVLLFPYWAGGISGEALMTGGHLLMLPAMAGAMLLRRHEYTGGHAETTRSGS